MSDPSDRQLAAARARILQLDAELHTAQQNIADLTSALESNRDIGAAIGIVMVTRGVESQAAFDLLRRASQSRHTKLRDVARDVVRRRALEIEIVPGRQPLVRRPVPTPPSVLREQVVDLSQGQPRVSG
jgi:hypothetical protein